MENKKKFNKEWNYACFLFKAQSIDKAVINILKFCYKYFEGTTRTLLIVITRDLCIIYKHLLFR